MFKIKLPNSKTYLFNRKFDNKNRVKLYIFINVDYFICAIFFIISYYLTAGLYIGNGGLEDRFQICLKRFFNIIKFNHS